MDELTAFVRARLDEDEAAANEALQATTGRWSAREAAWPGGLVIEDECGALILPAHTAGAHPQYPHIARHDPARVLREVEAKRAIMQTGASLAASHDKYIRIVGEGILTELAGIWSDHPDHHAEWGEWAV